MVFHTICEIPGYKNRYVARSSLIMFTIIEYISSASRMYFKWLFYPIIEKDKIFQRRTEYFTIVPEIYRPGDEIFRNILSRGPNISKYLVRGDKIRVDQIFRDRQILLK